MKQPNPDSGQFGNHLPKKDAPRRPAKARARRAAGIAAGTLAATALAATWAISANILPGQGPFGAGALAAVGSPHTAPAESATAPAESSTPEPSPAKAEDSKAAEKAGTPSASADKKQSGNKSAKGKGASAVPDSWPAAEKARAIEPAERAAVIGFVEHGTGISAKGEKPEKAPEPPDYSGIAFGAAKGELEASFTEYLANGWTQTGEVQVVGEPKVEEIDRNGTATQRVYICIDSSAIKVVEPDGHIVTPAAKPGTRKALNVYELQERDGKWLVVDHLFPNDPAC